jgi:hypothetical protein
VVKQARAVLDNAELAADMVNHNYELGVRYYSYRVLERRLAVLLDQCQGA